VREEEMASQKNRSRRSRAWAGAAMARSSCTSTRPASGRPRRSRSPPRATREPWRRWSPC
jgi:hypothetical protein